MLIYMHEHIFDHDIVSGMHIYVNTRILICLYIIVASINFFFYLHHFCNPKNTKINKRSLLFVYFTQKTLASKACIKVLSDY